MSRPDLNLLVALDALLEEGSVASAARRLRLSPSAMSRTLARLRAATGDPLLVRAGRALVPTPRAIELRDRVAELVASAEAVLRPVEEFSVAKLERTFTIRSREGFAETFGPALIARVSAEAPGVRLRFVQKLDKESAPLRDGAVDLETGVVDASIGPEMRAQALFRDRFVGVVRAGHPLSGRRVTVARYAGARHVGVAYAPPRRGVDPRLEKDQIDEALEALALARDVSATAGGFSSALALARASDLVATLPERHTAGLRAGMHTFPLPFPTPGLTISLLWHPRLDADAGHRWLRDCVRAVCASAFAR